jgi:outer membrane beta-barrel protein
MSRAAPHRAALAALLAATLLVPLGARAGNKADAFEGKIQPISGQLYQKAGRFELTPLGMLSIEDAFFVKYFGGLKGTWHFSEFLSVGGSFEAGATGHSGSTVVCPANQGCHPASAAELDQVPGRLRNIIALEAAWTPVYGKLNVLAERVAHFDLGLVAGLDLISHDEVLGAASAQALAAAGGSPSVKRALGGHVGVGVRLFLSEAVALRWEVKDLIYSVDVPNWQENGGAKHDLQNQLLTELGVSIFFPFSSHGGGR